MPEQLDEMSPRHQQRDVKERVLVQEADELEADQVRSEDGGRLHHGQVVRLMRHEVAVSLARSRVVVRMHISVAKGGGEVDTREGIKESRSLRTR